MSSAVCFQASESLEPQGAWQRLADPPFVAQRGVVLVLELPAGRRGPRAFVNGLPVIAGVQVLASGDLVYVVEPAGGKEHAFIVGAPDAGRVAGEGRPCGFTGLPITGAALVCPACGLLLEEKVGAELEMCPACHGALRAKGSQELPSEVLL